MCDILQEASFNPAVIGMIALLVGIFTELTKNVSFLKKFPTELQALICGVAFALIYLIYQTASLHLHFYWYQALGAIIQGMIAAFVAIYGWEKLVNMSQRLSGKKGDEHEQS